MTGNTQDRSCACNGGFLIDITGEVCPLTFVRTKLLIERMPPGAFGEVRLKGSEPLANVPRALRGEGHEIIELSPEEPFNPDPDRVYRLRFRKRKDRSR
jgi:TusA-related sulfurtransferase